jgi:hypothetical protein
MHILLDMSVRQSVCTIQLENGWKDFDETWYGPYTLEAIQNLYFLIS